MVGAVVAVASATACHRLARARVQPLSGWRRVSSQSLSAQPLPEPEAEALAEPEVAAPVVARSVAAPVVVAVEVAVVVVVQQHTL